MSIYIVFSIFIPDQHLPLKKLVYTYDINIFEK
jgi:hypothetical protein